MLTINPDTPLGTLSDSWLGGCFTRHAGTDGDNAGYLDLIGQLPYEVMRHSSNNAYKGVPPTLVHNSDQMRRMFDGMRARNPDKRIYLYTTGPCGTAAGQSPDDQADWVEQFLAWYGDDYRRHELYNEPASGADMNVAGHAETGGWTTAEWAHDNTKAYYDAVKAAHPGLEVDAFVYSTGQSKHGYLEYWLNDFIDRNLDGAFDNANIHSYGHHLRGQALIERMYDEREYLATDETRTGLLAAIRLVRAELDAAGLTDKGITLGEHFLGTGSTPGHVEQARFDVAGAIIAARCVGLGVRHFNVQGTNASRTPGWNHTEGIISYDPDTRSHFMTERGECHRDVLIPFFRRYKRVVEVQTDDPFVQAVAAMPLDNDNELGLLVQNVDLTAPRTVPIAGVEAATIELAPGEYRAVTIALTPTEPDPCLEKDEQIAALQAANTQLATERDAARAERDSAQAESARLGSIIDRTAGVLAEASRLERAALVLSEK